MMKRSSLFYAALLKKATSSSGQASKMKVSSIYIPVCLIFLLPELMEANKKKNLEKQSLTEQLNQEIAEIENSTKHKSFGYSLDGNLEGANDVTMDS